MPGDLHPADLAWALACAASLTAQVGLVRRHRRAKAPVMVSLTDMVNDDIAAFYFVGAAAFLGAYALIACGVALPAAPARALAAVMGFAAYGFLIYLALGAAVQYAHVRLRTTSLFEAATDEEARRTILAGVHASSAAVFAATEAAAGGSRFNGFLTGTPGGDQVPGWPRGATLFALIASSGAVNVVLRTVIFLERKRALDQDNGVGGGNNSGGTFCRYLLAAVLSAAPVSVFFFSAAASGDGPVAAGRGRLALAALLTCVLLPAGYVLSDRRLRHLARQSAGRCCSFFRAPEALANRVAPVQD